MNIYELKRFLGLLGFNPRPFASNALATVGAGTITGAQLVGGVVTRSGPVAAFTDTTDTAANIAAALPPPPVIGTSWEVVYRNLTAFTCTLAAGTGVTLSGNTTIPALSAGRFLVTYTASGTFTMVGLHDAPIVNMPDSKYTLNAAAGASPASAGDLTGARVVNAEYNGIGAAALTTRTATQMFSDTPNAQVGQSYELYIRNTNAGTLTLTAGVGVTLTGTMTIAQNVTRKFVVTFNSATTLTIQSMGVSAAAA